MRRQCAEDVDLRLALGYGSAWHVLRCLGFHRKRFIRLVAAEIGATDIEWCDFVPSAMGRQYTTHQHNALGGLSHGPSKAYRSA